MWSRVGMAAGLLRRRELRNFHARVVGIVDVEPAFAVAPDSRPGNLLHSVLAELFGSGLDFVYAERKMILRAKCFVVSGGWNVQHVLNPVVAIGNLQLIPVDAVFLHAAIP